MAQRTTAELELEAEQGLVLPIFLRDVRQPGQRHKDALSTRGGTVPAVTYRKYLLCEYAHLVNQDDWSLF